MVFDKAEYQRQYKGKIIVCKECGKEKPHVGLGLCKNCHRVQYGKNRYANDPEYRKTILSNGKKTRKKYQAMMKELKINGCAICGYDKCGYSLDFHHSNPEDKKFQANATNFSRMSSEIFISEMNKCILLCRNCHGEITELQKWWEK